MTDRTSRRAAIALSFVAIFAVLRLISGGQSVEAPVRLAPALRNEPGWYVVDRLQSHDDRLLLLHGREITARKGLHSWQSWAAALNDGARLALVGGTTVVFASAQSETAIVEGLKLGRTYVRVRNPNGPSIEFTAGVCGASYRLGDTISIQPFTTVSLEAAVAGAEGHTLQWIRSGNPLETVEISGSEVIRTNVQAAPGDWFSIVIFDDRGPTLLTGAIYTKDQ